MKQILPLSGDLAPLPGAQLFLSQAAFLTDLGYSFPCGTFVEICYTEKETIHQEFSLAGIRTPSEPSSWQEPGAGESCQERFLQRSQGPLSQGIK